MLTRASLSPAERQFYSKLHQLLSRPGLIRGNLVEMHRRCGKGGCRCQGGPRQRHRSLYLGFKLNGRQKMLYIPKNWEGRVREWVERYSQIREVLGQVSTAFVKRLTSREG